MKRLWIVPVLFAIVIGGLWATQGKHLATLTEKAITTTAIDDFGDEVKTVVWEETLEIGLDIAVPAIGGLVFLALGLFLPTNPKRSRLAVASFVVGALGLLGALASLVVAYTG